VPLNQLWDVLHNGVVLNEGIVSFAEIQTEITNLRRTYAAMAGNGGGPDFGNAKIREAYALAYHPGHAHAYLQIMLEQGLGDFLIQGLGKQPSVGVLGAGAGAETLAFCTFFALRGFQPDGATLSLVDQADWSVQRQANCFDKIQRMTGTLPTKIDSFIQDVASPDALSFLSQLVPNNDLIFCPAIYTELEVQHNGLGFINEVCRLMKSQSKILVIDQAEVNGFAAACNEMARIPQMQLLHRGDMTLRVPAPPDGSLASSVLDGVPYQIQNGRIARKRYHFSWVLLQKS
jgi:hypothetical protein